MRRLAVIPSDPVEAYKKKGIESWLEDYYNPLHFFDEVYLLSPLEKKEKHEFGMNVIPSKPKEIKSRIRELNIDAVRAYGGYWACDFACNNKVKGIPVVVSVHDTNPTLLHDSIKKADIVFCVSEAVKKLVLTKINRADKVWILPNRVNLEVMRPRSSIEFDDLNNTYPFKYRILHVGRKSKEKNLDTLMKALKILGNEYCIITIGEGDTDKYVELAENDGIIGRCYFIDSIRNTELPIYYSWADCMCTPSRWEGFGMVFIEALACESIVVTSDISPMNEYIEHMKNGLLVKRYENPESLADMIRMACTNKQLRESLRRNTRKSVESFEKSRIDKLEVSYYKKVLTTARNDKLDSFLGEKPSSERVEKKGKKIFQKMLFKEGE
jgi:glycosyltransferase involved in cell wall biosynthesis